MIVGKVIGTITLGRCHPSLRGACYRVTMPLSLANLANQSSAEAEPLVVYDDRGAGDGSLIAISEGGEAAQPFYPDMKPIDAYNAALLDTIDVEMPPEHGTGG